MNSSAQSKRKPQEKQARVQKTLDRLLSSAEELLDEGGFEALNSNAVVERAGMTPPAFYHYFKSKHDLLRILCERLMDAQNEILADDDAWALYENDGFRQVLRDGMEATLQVTREFRSGHVLLLLLRAIPELQPIRASSHDEMAAMIAKRMMKGQSKKLEAQLRTRARIAIEMSYSVIEMLFETNFANQEVVLDRVSAAIEEIFADIRDRL